MKVGDFVKYKDYPDSPVGLALKVYKHLQEFRDVKPFMRELIENDRVVGGINNKSTKAAAKFYKTFVEGEVLETNAKTAEMAKLTDKMLVSFRQRKRNPIQKESLRIQ